MSKENYIPALRFEFLTRFYDPLVRLTTREFSFKRALMAQANLQNKQKILDLACGSGTLSVAIAEQVPEGLITALDADVKILQMAKKKANKHAIKIVFECGFSDDLPFSDETFDRVFSTLAFHHLTRDQKIKTINEILRVLKPDGEFHLADYGLPRTRTQFILEKLICLIDGRETTQDNINGHLRQLLQENGFAFVERTDYFKTILGTIRLFKATK